MAYTADINIVVKGVRDLERVKTKLEETSASINKVNAAWQGASTGPKGLNAFNTALAKAKILLDRAQQGTEAETLAVKNYVTALNLANAARSRQNRLIQEQIAAQRKIIPGNAGFGVQGPALPPSAIQSGRAQTGGSRLGGIVSNAVIGGAFPLLFGQGGGAAAGGAIGGLVGGAFGGAGGFAGSLLGTLLGQIAGQAGQVKELAADIGFSAQQTQLLATAFKQAGADFDKFQESVSRIQGLGLSLEQQAAAIQLASTLTEAYGGKIDKVTNAFTNALQTGKVTQATLNQLTSAGIPIQEALANKYDVSRSKLLEMAKGGEISVQALLDALVDLGNNSEKVSDNVQSSFEQTFTRIADKLNTLTPRINEAFENVKQAGTSAFTNILRALEPLITTLADATVKALELYGAFVSAFAGIPGYVNNITNAVLNMIPGLNVLNIALNTLKGARGAQPQRQGPTVPARLQQAPIPRILAPAQMAAAGGGKGRGGGGGVDKAAREAERVAEIVRDRQAQTELLGIEAQLQQRIFAAEQAKDALLVARLQGEKDLLDIQFKYAQELAREKDVRAQAAIIANGLAEIDNTRLKTEQNLQKIQNDRTEKYNDLINNLNLELELKNITKEQDRERLRIEFEINELRKDGLYTEEQLAVIQQKRLALAAQDTPGQKRMKELQTGLSELTNQEAIAVAAADNIGQAFGTAFQDIVNGASSGQEAIANMMRSIGENFVNMAAQIIAQQITMIILGTILKALGIGFGGGGGASTGTAAGGISGSSLPGGFANPAVGAYSAPLPFAKGGVVGQPTIFKFADGAATRTGLMGEAGPEAIMPLQRGADGRLGVNAMGLREAMASGGAGTGPVLNMSFETTRFGDTEYVSRDQLEAAMVATRRQAATDGAKRGMSMTLDRIQNSTSTRRKIGI